MLERVLDFLSFTGIAHMYWGNVVMLAVGGLLIYAAIKKHYEPIVLLPIGFGVILSNLPLTGLLSESTSMEPGGLLYYLGLGVHLAIFPPIVFLGIGAMTDFTSLIANPKTFILGAAAQIGIFAAMFGALALGYSLPESSSIGIIGGADGPTAIYTAVLLAPHLLGVVAVAAYCYMALVPFIQPPIMRLLTTKRERAIVMAAQRPVSKLELILFPIGVTIVVVLLLPKAAPLVGMLMLGNLMRESGVVERLVRTSGGALMNIVVIFLCVCVGSQMSAEAVLNLRTLGIFGLGIFAFAIGTAGGVLIGKLMCWLTRGKINPLIGAAGVSAVPMSARVVQMEGQRADPNNYLLDHAMGPNVAGVIGSAAVAGLLISYLA